MARQRNYQVEYLRQKELAASRGYSSIYQMKKAVKEQHYRKAGRYRSNKAYQSARTKAVKASAQYSRTPSTQFPPNASAEQFRAYKKAFQRERNVKRSHEQYIKDLADYLNAYDPERYPDYDRDREFWNNY